MTTDAYPEHSKLRALGGANQIVGDFIGWLEEQGYAICEHRDSYQGEYVPIRASRDNLLARFFDIDLDRLEHEKRQILESLSQSA